MSPRSETARLCEALRTKSFCNGYSGPISIPSTHTVRPPGRFAPRLRCMTMTVLIAHSFSSGLRLLHFAASDEPSGGSVRRGRVPSRTARSAFEPVVRGHRSALRRTAPDGPEPLFRWSRAWCEDANPPRGPRGRSPWRLRAHAEGPCRPGRRRHPRRCASFRRDRQAVLPTPQYARRPHPVRERSSTPCGIRAPFNSTGTSATPSPSTSTRVTEPRECGAGGED